MTTTNLSAVADPLRLYDETFASRLLLGTARYPSPQSLEDAVRVSNPAMLTVALRRQSAGSPEGGAGFWKMLRDLGVPVLPNTAGCYSADEAYTLAQMSREVFETDWIKLEVIGDDYTLQPDTLALPAAAERLIRDGFKVLPYCTEDLVLCRRLLDVGCQALMPWAARYRPRAHQPVWPAPAARAPAQRAAHRRCGPGCAVTRHASHGMGLRRRAAQHRRRPSRRPGGDGAGVCDGHAGRSPCTAVGPDA